MCNPALNHDAYSTIYLLSTLKPLLLQEAEKDGLIRPELKRAELLEWRRKRGEKQNGNLRVRLMQLMRARTKLEAEIARLKAELAM